MVAEEVLAAGALGGAGTVTLCPQGTQMTFPGGRGVVAGLGGAGSAVPPRLRVYAVEKVESCISVAIEGAVSYGNRKRAVRWQRTGRPGSRRMHHAHKRTPPEGPRTRSAPQHPAGERSDFGCERGTSNEAHPTMMKTRSCQRSVSPASAIAGWRQTRAGSASE